MTASRGTMVRLGVRQWRESATTIEHSQLGMAILVASLTSLYPNNSRSMLDICLGGIEKGDE